MDKKFPARISIKVFRKFCARSSKNTRGSFSTGIITAKPGFRRLNAADCRIYAALWRRSLLCVMSRIRNF